MYTTTLPINPLSPKSERGDAAAVKRTKVRNTLWRRPQSRQFPNRPCLNPLFLCLRIPKLQSPKQNRNAPERPARKKRKPLSKSLCLPNRRWKHRRRPCPNHADARLPKKLRQLKLPHPHRKRLSQNPNRPRGLAKKRLKNCPTKDNQRGTPDYQTKGTMFATAGFISL